MYGVCKAVPIRETSSRSSRWERHGTRIGIRLAIGAKGKHVLLQFLLEAMALSIVGGVIGVAFGLLTPYLVSRFSSLPTDVSTSSILLAFGFAAAIGIFFGYYPARKASRLDPIDALRYE
jgi:putative ABC transport system permease protein